MTGNPSKCLFCDTEDPSPEHAWPLWIGKLRRQIVGDKTFNRLIRVEQRGRPVSMSQTFDRTTDRFCKKCNYNWMSSLETKCSPLLKRMMIPTEPAVSLAHAHRKWLATWAYKTALVMECLADPSEIKVPIPVSAYRQFFKGHKTTPESPPARGVRIWSAAFSGGTILLGQLARMSVTAKPRGTQLSSEYHLTTFTAYRAVFQVLGHIDGHRGEVENDPAVESQMTCLWPSNPHGIATWPPNGAGFSFEQLAAFERRESFR